MTKIAVQFIMPLFLQLFGQQVDVRLLFLLLMADANITARAEGMPCRQLVLSKCAGVTDR